MTITAPLGLLALAALPAVVLLHLLRNRLPERRVAALFLFPAAAMHSDGGRSRAPLLRSPSFWLECTMVLLLAAWLSGPSFAALAARHLVLVLDDSASMAASSTLAKVRVALRELGDGLGATDQVTVVRSGSLPTIAVGPRGDRGAFASFCSAWLPRQPGHDLLPALDLGRQLAAQAGELWLLTDGEVGLPLADVHLRACGSPATNAAVTRARRHVYDGGQSLLVTVTGYGCRERSLRLLDGERELARSAVLLPSDDEAVELTLPWPDHLSQLRVELGPQNGGEPSAAARDAVALEALASDALAIDDVAFVVEPPQRLVAICDQLAAATRQELQLDRVLAALSGWRDEPSPARAQLLLASTPSALVDGQIEVVLAATSGVPGGYRSPFVLDRAHPLLAGAAMDGVAWGAGGGEVEGHVLIASGAKVLLAEQWPAAGRRFCFDLDGRVGNLPRAPDWPVLWANLLELAANEVPGCRQHLLRVGDELQWRGGQQQEVRCIGPDGIERTRGRHLVTCIADRPGIYELRAPTEQLLAVAAANFVDAAESDLRTRSSFDHAPTVPVAGAESNVDDARPLRRWLALVLLAVMLADWWWLSRGKRQSLHEARGR